MGAGKKQTIGYRYYVGLHMVLCRQADALIEIKMSAKQAWRGSVASGQGFFNKPNLFGGDEREGGVSGFFDFLNGGPTQAINTYLAGVLGALTPAFRGAVSLVFRRPYLVANSARLPTMQFKVLNTVGIHRGWYPEKALINTEAFALTASVYIAWNCPSSMTTQQFEAQQEWLVNLIGSLSGARIIVQKFSDANGGIFPSLDGEHTGLIDWVNTAGPIDGIGTESDWEIAFGEAPGFFSEGYDIGGAFGNSSLISGVPGFHSSASSESQLDDRRNIVVLLGLENAISGTIAPAQALLAQIPKLELFAFKVDDTDVTDYLLIDNTPIDGVPIIDSTDPGAVSLLTSGLLLNWADMNPAHLIRCLWTDPMRGGVALEAEIDEANFTAAADLFYAEGLGLSPRFSGGESVEADRIDIERHADCISYRSRQNNLVRIKPVRLDYDPVDLPVLDSSIVMDWSNLEKSQVTEVPNQLTVVYTKRENGEPASVTRTNIAGVRRAGRVIPGEPIEYPACTVESLATRLCLRDLAVQNRPLLTGSITLTYFPPELDIGEPFIINEPKLQIDNVVVRITEVNEGDGINNAVTVTIVEDQFALPTVEASGPSPTPPTPPDLTPQLSPDRVIMEAPYYMLVLDQTQDTIDTQLLAEPDLGAVLATGTKASTVHRNINVGINDGSGYADAGEVDFVTATALLNTITAQADDVIVTVAASPALEGVPANSLALIGSEIVRIDAMTANGLDIDITIGRGCLDTVPAEHPSGSMLIFLQAADPLDSPTFLVSDVVGVKLLTNTSSRTLSLFAAPEDTITFASRAIRPYPPGKLQINGSYGIDQFDADLVLTWTFSDRTLQTTPIPEDATHGNIGPETGTAYIVMVDALDQNGDVISNLDTVNVGAVTTYDWDDATVLPDGTNRLLFTVQAERDGYVSWQSPSITTAVLYSPFNLVPSVGVGTIQLDWVDLNSGPLQEDDVLVYRATSTFDLSTLPTVLATLVADTITYTDATVSPGNTYYYAVVMRRGTLVAASFTNPITI